MSITLSIRDETATGNFISEQIIEFLTERITVRELIRSRVYQEVKDYNANKGKPFMGLIQPGEVETDLNGIKKRKIKDVDWKRHFELALEAFACNRIIVLVDDRQCEKLSEEIVLRSDTQVTFLKLVPLVGG